MDKRADMKRPLVIVVVLLTLLILVPVVLSVVDIIDGIFVGSVGGTRARGNQLFVNQTVLLTEIEHYFNPLLNPQNIEFHVLNNDSGTWVEIFYTTRAVQDMASDYYSSGNIELVLKNGSYYRIMTSWNDSLFYYWKNSVNPQYISFANVTTGCSQTSYPLVPASITCGSTTGYPQRLTSSHCVEPADKMNITEPTVLCEGTYDLIDADNDGLIKLLPGNAKLYCDRTVIRGNNAGYGLYATASSLIQDCEFRNLTVGIKSDRSYHWNATYNWTEAANNRLRAIAIDSNNNIIGAGSERSDGVEANWQIQKLNAFGENLWTTNYSWYTSRYDIANAVAIDSDDNIIAAGYWGNNTPSNHNDWALLKLNSSGDFEWNISLGPSNQSSEYLEGVAIDSEDNIIVCGKYDADLSVSIIYNLSIIKLDPSGTQIWFKNLHFNNSDALSDVAVDSQDNIIATGIAYIAEYSDARILKLSPSGDMIWNKTFNYGLYDLFNAVAVDSDDNIIAVGFTQFSVGNDDWYIMKLDDLGNTLWTRNFSWDSTGNDDDANDVAVDSQDNIYVAGQYYEGSYRNWRVMKLDPQGNEIWNLTYDWTVGDDDVARSIAIDSNDDVIVAGYKDDDIYWQYVKINSDGGNEYHPKMEIHNVSVFDVSTGLSLYYSDYSNFTDINVSGNSNGIDIYYSDNSVISRVDAFDTGDGVGCWYSSNVSVSDVFAVDSLDPVELSSCPDSSIENLFGDADEHGITIEDSPRTYVNNITLGTGSWKYIGIDNSSNSVISNITTTGSATFWGMNVYASENISFSNILITNVTNIFGAFGYGIGITSVNNIFFDNVSVYNSIYGINCTNCTNMTFRSSTFFNNNYSIYLDSDSTGNTFYYNNFTDSVNYHANAVVAGNHFNSTQITSIDYKNYQMDSDVAIANASFYGEGARDRSGWTVEGIGDVNGDGYNDILIGAYFYPSGGYQGKAYVIFGRSAGWSTDVNLSDANASFYGESSGDEAARSMAGAGDVNGDGYDDFIIGAPKNKEGGSDGSDRAGQAYLIFGRSSGWSTDVNLSDANASFYGESDTEWAGWAVAGLGDINGDDYDDIAISANYNSEAVATSGQTYIILGKSSGWSMDVNLSDADASFRGESSGDQSGYAISGVGDVNNDSYDDLVICAPYNDDAASTAGQCYLILGKSSGWNMDVSLSTANASYRGEVGGDRLGIGSTGAGDVNGDGYDDFLIGARYNDEGGSNAGQIYLIFGKSSGWSMDVSASQANASFLGQAADDELSSSLSGAGDVNWDGYDDFLMGTTLNDEGGTTAGQAYLVLGRGSGWSMDINVSNASFVNASFIGSASQDSTGSVAGLGDVDGDGKDDFAVGAGSDDSIVSNAGKTSIFRTGNWTWTNVGNTWDDIKENGLEIYDNTGDGFGDYGDDYPYSNANGGNVTGFVTDYAPMDVYTCYDADGDGAYNTSSDAECPGYRDCNDADPRILPPRDNLDINESKTLCPGTFYINDSGVPAGALIFSANGVNLTCNGTIMIGNGSNTGIYANSDDDIGIFGCNVSNYFINIRLIGSKVRMENITTLNASLNGYGVYMYLAGNSTLKNVTISGAWRGLTLISSADSNLTEIYAYSNSDNGLYIDNSNNTRLINSDVWENDDNNIYITRSDRSLVENVSSRNSSDGSNSGIQLRYSKHCILDNITVTDNYEGLYLYTSENTNVTRLTAVNNTYGIYMIASTHNSTVRNSTFQDNLRGVFLSSLISFSRDNMFYHNDFISNTFEQAKDDSGGNYFNNSDGEGNYWDDIEISNILIFDNDFDGWGDSGPEYPYNETNRGDVEGMQDFGPMMSDADRDGDPDWRDCDDDDNTTLSPRDDLYITEDITLCPGTYQITDLGNAGVIIASRDHISITCNQTIISANTSGAGFYVNQRTNVSIIGCSAVNYSNNIYVLSSRNTTLVNDTSLSGGISVWIQDSNHTVISNLYSANNYNNFRSDDSNHITIDGFQSYNSSDSGMYFVTSTNLTLTNGYSFNSTLNGLSFSSPGDVFLQNITVEYTLTEQGIYFATATGVELYNITTNNNFDGLYLFNSDYAILENITSIDNSNDGLVLRFADNVALSDVYLQNNSNNSIYLWSSNDCEIENATIIDGSDYGIYGTSSNDVIIKNCTLRNNSVGVYLLDSLRPNITLSLLVNNTAEGISLVNTDDGIVTNSTIQDNAGDGIQFDSSSTGTLIYWNRFYNNVPYQVNAAGAGNYFNNSLGQGNFWYDIITNELDIYDGDLDGWGDGGLDYPYSLANGGNVTANVTDYGPMLMDADHDGDPEWTDCDDNDNTTLSPRDNLYINTNITLCPGTYPINDTDLDGVLILNASNVKVTCDRTVMIGESVGYGIYETFANDVANITIDGCNFSTYTQGLWFVDDTSADVDNITLKNIHVSNSSSSSAGIYLVKWVAHLINVTADNNYRGIAIEDGDDSTLSQITVSNNQNYGLIIYSSADVALDNITAFNNGNYGISIGSGSGGAVISNIYARNNSGAGLQVTTSGGTVVNNLTTLGNDDEGLYLYNSPNCNITDVNSSDNDADELYFTNSGNSILIDITVNDNTAGSGVRILNSDDCVLINISAVGENYGINIDNSANCVITNATVTGSQLAGVRVNTGSDNVTINSVQVYSNTYVGVLSTVAHNLTLNHVVAWNHSWAGIMYNGAYDGEVFNVTSFDNADGLRILNSDRIIVSNSSFYNNTAGINISGSSDNNLIYYCNMTNNTLAHASDSSTGPNHWNISVYGEARGNWWSDVTDFEIYDTDNDGWADTGVELPYNTSFGTHTIGPIEDWGPATSRFINCTIINTDIRGSNIINEAYHSRGCYLENSTVTYSNVTNAVVINSTINRSVLLDSYIENTLFNDSYVEFSEILDAVFCGVFNVFSASIAGNQLAGGQITYNGTDYYAPVLLSQICAAYIPPYDPSAPTAPTVYDGVDGADIDWFNDNTTLSAWWDGATEDASTIYYRYIILENETCLTGYCSWTSAGTNVSATVTGLNLLEGSNYSFVVEAYNAYGGNSSNATSDGAVLDMTDPGQPTITSTTHPDQTATYGDRAPIFLWNSTDPLGGGVVSGIEGYSFVLDDEPESTPDNILDMPVSVLQTMPAMNSYQAISDESTGDTFATFSEITQNVSAGDTFQIRFGLLEADNETDDDMSYVVYAIRKSDSAGTGDFDYDQTAYAVSNIIEISRDIIYSADPADATTYSASLVLNESVNSSTSDVVYIVVAAAANLTYTNDLAIILNNETFDNSTKTFTCREGSCVDITDLMAVALEVKLVDSGDEQEKQYSDLADGEYYFHVRAKDNAGNWGRVSHHNITISTGGVVVTVREPDDGDAFTTEPINVTVRTSDDASVYVVAEHPDGSNDTTTTAAVNGTYTFTGIDLEQGVNAIYARATADNGAVTTSTKVYVIYDPVPYVTNYTLEIFYSESGTSELPYLVYDAETDYIVGIATENAVATGSASPLNVLSDTSFYTTKIFMTTSGASMTEVKTLLEDDELLDEINPMFALERLASGYLIAAQLRYPDIYLSGFEELGSGKYELTVSNEGLTDEGLLNLTVEVS